MKVKRKTIGPYAHRLWLVHGTWEEYKKRFFKVAPYDAEPYALAAACKTPAVDSETGENYEANVILIYFNSKYTIAPEVMAHECMHAVDHIFDGIGESPAEENMECRAYLLEYLVRECRLFLKQAARKSE